MRVLIVEDDSAVAQAVKAMLTAENYVVDSTNMGEDGLDIAKLYDYDIILLDLMLPDVDGYKLLERLRYFDNISIRSWRQGIGLIFFDLINVRLTRGLR